MDQHGPIVPRFVVRPRVMRGTEIKLRRDCSDREKEKFTVLYPRL